MKPNKLESTEQDHFNYEIFRNKLSNILQKEEYNLI